MDKKEEKEVFVRVCVIFILCSVSRFERERENLSCRVCTNARHLLRDLFSFSLLVVRIVKIQNKRFPFL